MSKENRYNQSHPVWVRGLKLIVADHDVGTDTSHPVWVRGLKLTLLELQLSVALVAPRVGAWIETLSECLHRSCH